jgi:D-sedoheptulose 7-phosphate isomerase
LGLTTSGTSENVLEALKTAKSGGLKTIALCGRNTRDLNGVAADLMITVDSSDTPAIQEIHLFMLHTIAERLEAELTGESRSHGD